MIIRIGKQDFQLTREKVKLALNVRKLVNGWALMLPIAAISRWTGITLARTPIMQGIISGITMIPLNVLAGAALQKATSDDESNIDAWFDKIEEMESTLSEDKVIDPESFAKIVH